MEAREGKMDPPHTHSLDSRLGPAGLKRAHCPGPLLRGAWCQGRCQTQRGHALVGAPWGACQLPQPLRGLAGPHRVTRAVHVQERQPPPVPWAVLAVTGAVPSLSPSGDSPLFSVWLLLEVWLSGVV